MSAEEGSPLKIFKIGSRLRSSMRLVRKTTGPPWRKASQRVRVSRYVRRPLVRDRWHNGAHHGYFLDVKFYKTFWKPFLRDGTFIEGASVQPAMEFIETARRILEDVDAAFRRLKNQKPRRDRAVRIWQSGSVCAVSEFHSMPVSRA